MTEMSAHQFDATAIEFNLKDWAKCDSRKPLFFSLFGMKCCGNGIAEIRNEICDVANEW